MPLTVGYSAYPADLLDPEFQRLQETLKVSRGPYDGYTGSEFWAFEKLHLIMRGDRELAELLKPSTSSSNAVTIAIKPATSRAYFSIFIGELRDDGFDYDDIAHSTGRLPYLRSPTFPPRTGRFRAIPPFYEFIQKIETGAFEGKQVYHNSWVARVSKRQLVDFVQENYPVEGSDDWPLRAMSEMHYYAEEYKPKGGFPESVEELKWYIQGLNPGRRYTLSALDV